MTRHVKPEEMKNNPETISFFDNVVVHHCIQARAIDIERSEDFIIKNSVFYSFYDNGISFFKSKRIKIHNNLLGYIMYSDQMMKSMITNAVGIHMGFSNNFGRSIVEKMEIINNTVAGSVDAAYVGWGQNCGNEVNNVLFENNLAHSIGVGMYIVHIPLHIDSTNKVQCQKFSKFTAYKCFQYCIISQNPASITISDVVVSDFWNGIFGRVNPAVSDS